MRVFLLSQNLVFANQLLNQFRQERHFVQWWRDVDGMLSMLKQQSTDVLLIDDPVAFTVKTSQLR